MKLRIRGNSLRLRLGQSEVTQLVMDGCVSASIRFSGAPDGQLTYLVRTAKDAEEISGRLSNHQISVTIPERLCRRWAESQQVGLTQHQRINSATTLSILIEKDFKCLEPRPGEDQSDTFANPHHGKACKPSDED